MELNTQTVWINLSKLFPDKSEHWLATNKQQYGKSVHCIIDGKTLAVGCLLRENGTFKFLYKSITNSALTGTDIINHIDKFDRVEWFTLTPSEQKERDEKNDFAIDALAVLAKVLHALQSSNMKGTILHQEISAAVKKGMSSPLRIKKDKSQYIQSIISK